MDLTLLGEIKFGEGAKWSPRYKCSWCEKALRNQTEERYLQKGNMCEECSAKIHNSLMERNMTEKQIGDAKEISRKIKEKQELMDLLSEGLDVKDLPENERQIIYHKMRMIYDDIKQLRRML